MGNVWVLIKVIDPLIMQIISLQQLLQGFWQFENVKWYILHCSAPRCAAVVARPCRVAQQFLFYS